MSGDADHAEDCDRGKPYQHDGPKDPADPRRALALNDEQQDQDRYCQEAIVERGLWEQVQQHLARGRKARREGTRARVPSFLLGLLYNDSGARYTPTHSSKGAKRYRYYMLQAGSAQQPISGPVERISALDLEAVVLQRLLAWLSEPLPLLDALSHPGDDTLLAQTLLAAARARCRAWPTLTGPQVREFVRVVVLKVTIGPGNIAIALSKSAMRAWLLEGADNTSYEPEDDLFELSIEASLQRRGRAVRLVISREAQSAVPSQHEAALVHALAQAHQWLEQLLSGELSSLRMIAGAVGKSERYVSKRIRAAFLAPDLVEVLLERRGPPELTLAELTKDLPYDWNEQRRLFGFAPRCERARIFVLRERLNAPRR